MEWDPLVKDVSKVTMATAQDVISISFNCTSIIARTVHYLRECFGGEINAIYSRQVHVHVILLNGFFGPDDKHFSSDRKITVLILIKMEQKSQCCYFVLQANINTLSVLMVIQAGGGINYCPKMLK